MGSASSEELQGPSQNWLWGQILAQIPAKMFSSLMTLMAPLKFRDAICLMNLETSTPAGQPLVQGASWQWIQREASVTASWGEYPRLISEKAAESSL
jgi:hypothetical protein